MADATMRLPRFVPTFLLSVVFLLSGCSADSDQKKSPALSHKTAAIEQFCGQCHRNPQPESLPGYAWRPIVEEMHKLAGFGDSEMSSFSMAEAIAHYERRAPDSFPASKGGAIDIPSRNRFRRRPTSPGGAPPTPAVANIQLVDLLDDERLELLVCDMRHGVVLCGTPYIEDALYPIATQLGNPCRATVVDLDGDGMRDIVVSDLGQFSPGDSEKGRVLLLRRTPGKQFAIHELAVGLARPCDAQPIDADRDGDLDLVVSAFGWRQTGALYLLENRSENDDMFRFVPHELDTRPGSLETRITDVDGDGNMDVVCAVAQQFEEIAVYRNQGELRFEREPIYQAPHPSWGLTGIELVDLDKDGDLDIVVSNGDTLDSELLKPYHGIFWLENRSEKGRLHYVEHPVGKLYGVHRAVPTDLDGDGDIEIVAAAFLPHVEPLHRKTFALESVVWFENENGAFHRRILAATTPFHATLAAGDVEGDGDIDLALGYFTLSLTGEVEELEPWVELWMRRGGE